MMTPESERAITHDEAMEAAQTLIDHMFRNVTTRRVQTRIPAEPTDTDVLLTTYIRQQKEKDSAAALTCSEVVERLLNECVGGHDAWVDREKATAILHSWRECRVQELEELVGKLRCENEWIRSLKPEELSYRNGVIDGFHQAHEPARCGHARGNWKDPKYGTPEYAGDERCEICAQLTTAFGLLQEVLNYGAESATSFGGLKLKISKFLHSDESREQIRKGANHG